MTEKKAKYSEKMVTPEGRLSWVYVFEKPPVGEDGKERKYECTIYIPKDANPPVLKKLFGAVDEIGAAAFGPKWKGNDRQKNPTIRDGDESGDPNQANCWVIKARTKDKPTVCGPDLEPLFSKEELYAGCYGRFNVTFGPYDKAGNWGVSAYLNAVMKTRDGERFGQAPTTPKDAFGDFAEEADGHAPF